MLARIPSSHPPRPSTHCYKHGDDVWGVLCFDVFQVCSPRHWPVTWEVESDRKLSKALRKGCVVHVQRKIGHLSYSEDPSGLRNLLVRSFPKRSSESTHSQSKAEFVQTFSGDPEVLAFAKYMCTSQVRGVSVMSLLLQAWWCAVVKCGRKILAVKPKVLTRLVPGCLLTSYRGASLSSAPGCLLTSLHVPCPQPVQTEGAVDKQDSEDQAEFSAFCTGSLAFSFRP